MLFLNYLKIPLDCVTCMRENIRANTSIHGPMKALNFLKNFDKTLLFV